MNRLNILILIIGLMISYGSSAVVFSSGPNGHALKIDSDFVFSFKASSEETVKEVKTIIEEEIKKYPEGLVDKLVDDIYIVDAFEINGYRHGGGYAFGHKFIFLSVENRLWGLFKSIEKNRGMFHHELAKFIFTSHPFNIFAWIKLMPEEWQKGGFSQNGLGIKDGFITSHATTDVFKDFSEYAEMIFMEPEKIITYAKHYTMVKNKLCYFRTIYLDYDKRFDVYFSKYRMEKICDGLDFSEILKNEFIKYEGDISIEDVKKAQIDISQF